MAKPTPGPWVIDLYDTGARWNIDDQHGASVAIAHQRAPGGKDPERDANARLIAAAPELLAHAKADLAKLEYYVGNPSAWERYDDTMSARLAVVVESAREVIAKAEGK